MRRSTLLMLLISAYSNIHTRKLSNYHFNKYFHQRFVRNVNNVPLGRLKVSVSNRTIVEDVIEPKIIPGRREGIDDIKKTYPVMDSRNDEDLSAPPKGILNNVMSSGQKTLDTLSKGAPIPIVGQALKPILSSVSRIVQRDPRSNALKADIPKSGEPRPITNDDPVSDQLANLYNRTDSLMKDLNDEYNLLAQINEDNSDKLKYAMSVVNYFLLQVNRIYYNKNSTNLTEAIDDAIKVIRKEDKTAVQFSAPVIRALDVYRSFISLPVEIVRSSCRADELNHLCVDRYQRISSVSNKNDPCSNGRLLQSRIFELSLRVHDEEKTKSNGIIWDLYKRIYLKVSSREYSLKMKRSVANNLANNLNSAPNKNVNAANNIQEKAVHLTNNVYNKNSAPNAQVNVSNHNVQNVRDKNENLKYNLAQNNIPSADSNVQVLPNSQHKNVPLTNAPISTSNIEKVNSLSHNGNIAHNHAAPNNVPLINEAISSPQNVKGVKTVSNNANPVQNNIKQNPVPHSLSGKEASNLVPYSSVASKALHNSNATQAVAPSVGPNIGLAITAKPEPVSPNKSPEPYIGSGLNTRPRFDIEETTDNPLLDFIINELKKLKDNGFQLGGRYEVYKTVADAQKSSMICNTINVDNVLDIN